MKKLTQEQNKKVIKMIFWIGIPLLAILIILSIIGILISIFTEFTLLNESVSLFVSSISSLMTIIAILLTVKSNNDNLELHNREVDMHIKEVKLQNDNLNLQQTLYKRSINSKKTLMTSTLCPEYIEIKLPDGVYNALNIPMYDSAHPPITKNLKIVVIIKFYMRNAYELQNFILKRFNMVAMLDDDYSKKMISIIIENNSDCKYFEFKGAEHFEYYFTTNVEEKIYLDYIKAARQSNQGRGDITIGFDLTSVDGERCEYNKTGEFILIVSDLYENKLTLKNKQEWHKSY